MSNPLIQAAKAAAHQLHEDIKQGDLGACKLFLKHFDFHDPSSATLRQCLMIQAHKEGCLSWNDFTRVTNKAYKAAHFTPEELAEEDAIKSKDRGVNEFHYEETISPIDTELVELISSQTLRDRTIVRSVTNDSK